MAIRPMRKLVVLATAAFLGAAAMPAASSAMAVNAVEVSPGGEGTTTSSIASLDGWYEARATLFYEDGSTSLYEIVAGPDGRYRVLGQHRDGAYSEEVFYARGVQDVVFRGPGYTETQSFVHSEHFAFDALRQAVAGASNPGASRISLATRHGGTFVFDEAAIREISAAEGANAVAYVTPLEVVNRQEDGAGAGVAEPTGSVRALRAYAGCSPPYYCSTKYFATSGNTCIRSYLQYRSTDDRVYGYAQNVWTAGNKQDHCWWVWVTLWEGGIVGTTCQILYPLGSGSVSTSISSKTGYATPPLLNDRVCSKNIAWDYWWAVTVNYEGHSLYVP